MRTFRFFVFGFVLLSITACNEDIDQLPILLYGTWESTDPHGQHEERVLSFKFFEDGSYENAVFIRNVGTLENFGYMMIITGNFRVENNVLITFNTEVYASEGTEPFVPREELVQLDFDWQEGRRNIQLQNNNTRLILESECITDNCPPYTEIYEKVG